MSEHHISLTLLAARHLQLFLPFFGDNLSLDHNL
jgi:hypothetical protein